MNEYREVEFVEAVGGLWKGEEWRRMERNGEEWRGVEMEKAQEGSP